MLDDWLFPQESTSGPGELGSSPRSPDSPPTHAFSSHDGLLNHVQSPGPPMGATSLPTAIPQAFPPTGKAVQGANMMHTFIKMI